MDLKQARHPLIDPEIIVPNNIMLGKILRQLLLQDRIQVVKQLR